MAVTDSTILTGVINICVNKYAESGPEYKSFYPQTETAQIVDFNDATGEIIDNRLADYDQYGDNGTIKSKNLIAKNNINVYNSTITQSLKVSDKADIDGTLTAKNITATNSIVIKNGSDVTLQLNNNGEITAALKGNADTASALQNAKSIDGVQFNGTNNIHHFGISSTPGQNQEKLVIFPGDMASQANNFVISDGLIIAIKFTQANDADNPKIKIGTNAAIPIYYRSNVIPKKAIKSNSTYVFVYDTGKFYLLGDLNVYYTNQLFVTSTINGTSNEVTSNDNTYLHLIEKDNDNNIYQSSSIKVKGLDDVIVSSSNGTITIASKNNYVEQNNITINNNYPILLKNGTGDSKTTDSVLFNQSVTVNPSNGTITANKFKGNLDGNANTATRLASKRSINIQDSAGNNIGTAISFDGSDTSTLYIRLPSTITANLNGIADKAKADNRNNTIDSTYIKNIEINSSGLMVLIRGDDTKQQLGATKDTYVTQIQTLSSTNYPILLKNGTGTSTITKEALFSSGVTINPSTSTITAKAFKGDLDGTATKANQLTNNININIKDNAGNNAGVNTSFNGSSNISIKLPTTIEANLTGTADKAKKDNNNNIIDSTYIKSISINGSTMTTTYGNNSTANIILPVNTQSTNVSSDNQVIQSLTSDNNNYPVLLKNNVGTDTYTGGVLFSSGITVNPSTSIITAKTFKGNLTGTANKATYDSSGHKFENYYATKAEINAGSSIINNSNTIALAKEITLLANNWINNDDTTTNNIYPKKYTITDDDVTVNDIVKVIIKYNNQTTANTLRLGSIVVSSENQIVLLARNTINNDINIMYYIYSLTDNDNTPQGGGTDTTQGGGTDTTQGGGTDTTQGGGTDTTQGGGTDTTQGGGTDTTQGGGTDTTQGGGADTTQGGGTDTTQGGGTDTTQGGGTDTTQGGGTDTTQGGGTDTTQGGGTDTTQGGGTDTTQGGGTDTTQGGGTDDPPVIIYTNEYIDRLKNNNLTITANDWKDNTNNSYANAGYKFIANKEVTDVQSEYDIIDVALANMYKAQGKYYNMLKATNIYPVVNITTTNGKYYINLYAKQQPVTNIPVSYYTYRGINAEKLDSSAYMPKVYSRTTEISNIASAWENSGNNTYPYRYEITNNDITEYSIVEMVINIESKQVAEKANIMPTVVSEKGKFYVYAKTIPSNKIAITWRLYHGADSDQPGSDTKYMFKKKINSVSLKSTSWNQLTTAYKGYNYKYSINVSGLTANDIVELIINSANKNAAHAAGMCPVVETTANYINLYSVYQPTTDIQVEYYIYQGATNGYTTSTTTDELEDLITNTDTTQGGGTDTTQGGGTDTTQGGGTDTTQGSGTDTTQGGGTDTTQGGGTDTTQGGGTDTTQGGGTDTTQGGGTDTTQGGGTDESEPVKEYMERLDNNVTAFSINNTSGTGNEKWNTHSDTAFADYKYKYTKNITGITANDVVDIFTKDIINYNSATSNIIAQAEICPVVNSSDNTLVIYSKYIPKNAISNIAYRVYQGTDSETNDTEPYMPKVYSRQATIVNTTNKWLNSGNSAYPYRYEIVDNDITVNDVVEVVIHPDSKQVANTANIMPVVTIDAGKFYVYTKTIPSKSINITWRLYHGANNDQSGSDTKYMFKKKINSVSLKSTSWSSLTTAYKGYNYKYSINVPGLTANDIVELIINSANKNAAHAAGMCPVVETTANYINLYSAYQPTTDIQVEYYIYQGK